MTRLVLFKTKFILIDWHIGELSDLQLPFYN